MAKPKPPNIQAVRANGGFLRHLLVTGGNYKSLCGHEPKSTTSMGRAGWNLAINTLRDCKKCFEKAKQLGLEIPGQVTENQHDAGDKTKDI